MKRVIAKNTLSFQTSKSMRYLRTPLEIWNPLQQEFNFTLDACASDANHLLPKYYTACDSALDHDWTNEVAYIHPLFDGKINKFVKKAYETPNFTGVFLIPAQTHTKYFHDYIYKNPNVEIRFLRNPRKGWHFGHDDGSVDDPEKIGYIKGLMIVIFRNQ